MTRLGGGAGFDLDSLLTIVERSDGGEDALGADVGRGRDLVKAASDGHLEEFRRELHLASGGAELRSSLLEYAGSPRCAALAAFLDEIAAHLAGEGYRVRRLPFFLVPDALAEKSENLAAADFEVSWNNVVLDLRSGVRRAEGFSNALAEGDALAAAAFAESGYRMDFLPPIPGSILHNGGYRCASNHLRTPEGFRPPAAGAR